MSKIEVQILRLTYVPKKWHFRSYFQCGRKVAFLATNKIVHNSLHASFSSWPLSLIHHVNKHVSDGHHGSDFQGPREKKHYIK